MVENKNSKEQKELDKRIKFLEFLQDSGISLTLTRRGKALQVMTYEKYLGKDYAQHLDSAFDAIRPRGYSFMPWISYDFWNFDYGDPVSLTLRRVPPQNIFDGEGNCVKPCPYGAWFNWEITANHSENILTVKREVVDPTKSELKEFQGQGVFLNSYLTDSIEEKIEVKSEKEMFALFRRNTLEALSQLSDFSKLNPEPPLWPYIMYPETEKSLKFRWRSEDYYPKN